MKKTQKIIIELTIKDIEGLIKNKYGGSNEELTEISFKIGSTTNLYDRTQIPTLESATVTVTKRLE